MELVKKKKEVEGKESTFQGMMIPTLMDCITFEQNFGGVCPPQSNSGIPLATHKSADGLEL